MLGQETEKCGRQE